jgi:hypothetical protein
MATRSRHTTIDRVIADAVAAAIGNRLLLIGLHGQNLPENVAI